MFPQIRQIQRLVGLEQSTQAERVGVARLADGIEVEERRLFDDVRCEESRVWEYRQTGQLYMKPVWKSCWISKGRRLTGYHPTYSDTYSERYVSRAPLLGQ
jgi:hypothetical protein